MLSQTVDIMLWCNCSILDEKKSENCSQMAISLVIGVFLVGVLSACSSLFATVQH